MALLFLDSFDHYSTAHITRKWTENELTALAVDADDGLVTGCYVRPTGGRRGGGCLRISSVSWHRHLFKTIAPAPTSPTVVVGCAFRYTVGPNFCLPFLWVGEAGGAHVGLALETDGTLKVICGTDFWEFPLTSSRNYSVIDDSRAVALHQDVWYYVELKATIHASAGTWELRVNEETISSGSGVCTRNTTYPGTGQWNVLGFHQLGYAARTGGSYDIDDLYVLDGAGSSGNDFFGDVEIYAHHPSGAGSSSDWTPTSGDNYEMVDDETPDDDTTVNATTTVDHADLFEMATMHNPTGEIYGLQIVGGYQKDESGTAQLQQGIKVNGTVYYADTKYPSSGSYCYETDCYSVSPDTGDRFTAEEFNSIEAGYKRTA